MNNEINRAGRTSKNNPTKVIKIPNLIVSKTPNVTTKKLPVLCTPKQYPKYLP